MKRSIPVLLLLLVSGFATAWTEAGGHEEPEFAAVLREAGLPELYRMELRTQCVEKGDLYACFEHAAIYEQEAVRERRPTLVDSVTWSGDRRRQSTRLLQAGLHYRVEDYSRAIGILESIIEEFPGKDLLVEAVLMRSQCLYHLGRFDEALVGLRNVSPHLPEVRVPDLSLYVGLCEEEKGNLPEAERLFAEAESGGSPDAVFHLLRLKLKQGDLRGFDVIAKEVAGAAGGRRCRDVCRLAREMEVALPRAWHALMGPVVADTAFTAAEAPMLPKSIANLAEIGEDMTSYCEQLLSRPLSPADAGWLRYARALSTEDTTLCDSLAAIVRFTKDRDLKARSLVACLTSVQGDETTSQINRLLPHVSSVRAGLSAQARLELAVLLARAGRGELGRGDLADLLSRLKPGQHDYAIFRVATTLENAGATDEALPAYRKLSESPVPSLYTLNAEKALYLIERTGPPEGDMADVIERVAGQDVGPVELGDLFAGRLHDFERAADSYRRALKDLPEGISKELIEIKLAEALAAGALGTGERGPGAEALNLIEGLADTSVVAAGEVLRVLKVSTDWLSKEHGQAFDIVRSMGRREDLTSRDLYMMATTLFHLFSERDANVYAQCAVTLRRLAKDYPTSAEAPLGAFLGAKLKFLAGDYVGALESFQACREVWRKHVVTPLCEEGIGDCYLYSGGLEEALERYAAIGVSADIAFKRGQCYELLDRPDSAFNDYMLGRGKICSPSLAKSISLRLALLTYERDGLERALESLDSPFPSIRKRLRPVEETIAAYALGQSGYLDLATGILTRISAEDEDIGCDALLLLSRLGTDDAPGKGPKRDGQAEASCQSIFGALRLLYERAYLACTHGPPDSCGRQRGRYQQRFPLDQRSRLRFDVQEALLLYREGEGESAGAIVDSLAASGSRDEVLAYGLYREGIRNMVDADYAQAVRAFRRIEKGYPGSDLYPDAVFKLGTAYYVLEAYDSSAFYFDIAARAGKASLVEDAYFNLGLALEEAGSLEEASEAFQSLALRSPFSERFERALMRAGYTLQQAGRPREAVELYEALLRYAEDTETLAEALYWIGESFAEMGRPLRAACEFLRLVHLFPDGGPWTGTAAFRAGLECEKAGLPGHAVIVYRENVARFGTGSDWGRASGERLDELERPGIESPEGGESSPDDATGGSEVGGDRD